MIDLDQSILVLFLQQRLCSSREFWDTILFQLIPDLASVWPHNQFHTLSGLLDSHATQKHACNTGRQFVPFLWSLVRLVRDAKPTTYHARGGHSKPTRHGPTFQVCRCSTGCHADQNRVPFIVQTNYLINICDDQIHSPESPTSS